MQVLKYFILKQYHLACIAFLYSQRVKNAKKFYINIRTCTIKKYTQDLSIIYKLNMPILKQICIII